MAQIFYVHCPACGGKFPCHSELWQAEYDLLCPFCQHSFPQEESPLIISVSGEQRPGRAFRDQGEQAPGQSSQPADPSAHAESM